MVHFRNPTEYMEDVFSSSVVTDGPWGTKTDGRWGWAGEDSKLELEQTEPSLQFQWIIFKPRIWQQVRSEVSTSFKIYLKKQKTYT